MKTRYKLQQRYAKWPIIYEYTFITNRNTLTQVVNHGKENYYKTSLMSMQVMSEKNNNEITSDPKETAEGFKRYFIEVSANLICQILRVQFLFGSAEYYLRLS